MSYAVVVLSGGLDSTVALWSELLTATIDLRLGPTIEERCARGVTAVTVDYGQRHRREISAARAVVECWQAEAAHRMSEGRRAITLDHVIVEAPSLGHVLSGSALTDQTIAVPHGHYTAPTMVDTIVPNRNMIISSIAAGIAVARKAERLVLGVHAGDHPIYPDCRPEFVQSLQHCIQVGTGTRLHVDAPFLTMTKDQIVRMGADMATPMNLTWSCYQGGNKHCGKCGTCVERREAFSLANVSDPTEYEE